MDIQSFIQSGLLETYVLGQCTADERAIVERIAAEQPSVQAELAAIEQALESYALATAVSPPPALKERIMDTIDQQGQMPSIPPPAGKPRSASNLPYQALALGFALLAAFFWYRQKEIRSENAPVQQSRDSLQRQLFACGERSEQLRQIATFLRDPDTKAVKMTDGKEYAIYMYHNVIRAETNLDLSGLGVPDPGKYYQIWAIVAGKPLSLGMVNKNALASWQKVDFPKDAEAFAISAENNPNGNPTPSVVIAIGKLVG